MGIKSRMRCGVGNLEFLLFTGDSILKQLRTDPPILGFVSVRNIPWFDSRAVRFDRFGLFGSLAGQPYLRHNIHVRRTESLDFKMAAFIFSLGSFP